MTESMLILWQRYEQLIKSEKPRSFYFNHDSLTFKTFTENISNDFSFGYLITKLKLSPVSQMNWVY